METLKTTAMIWFPVPIIFLTIAHFTANSNPQGVLDWTPRYQSTWHKDMLQQGHPDRLPHSL